MILTVDIGNTNITLGAYLENELKFVSRLATDPNLTADQYAIQLKGVLALRGIPEEEIENAILATVVPAAGEAFSKAIELLFGKKPLVLGPGIKTGLNIKIDNPAQLGADLVAGAVGAADKYPYPTIIIDLGTATTLTVIDKNGALLGGSIAAGIRSTLDALATKTSLLPSIHIEAPKSVIGSNTIDCMKSGLVIGAAAMLDGMIDRIEDEIGSKATVVATGGLSEMVIKECRKEIIYDNDLLLDGLFKIYKKNI